MGENSFISTVLHADPPSFIFPTASFIQLSASAAAGLFLTNKSNKQEGKQKNVPRFLHAFAGLSVNFYLSLMI